MIKKKSKKKNFVWSNAQQAYSAHKKETDDCVVRAISLTTMMSYNKAWEHCKKFGREDNDGVTLAQLRKILDNLPFPHRAIEITKHLKGVMKQTPEKFIETFPIGNYILSIPEHVTVVRDGRIFDDSDNRKDRIYNAWLIN